MAELDRVGVQAVFEGFADYLQKVGAFNRANDSTAVSVKKAADASSSVSAVTVAAGVAYERYGERILEAGKRAAEAVIEFGHAQVSLQNQAGITEDAAQGVGESILKMGQDSLFSAHEMITAITPVAGRYETLTGKTLDAAGAQTVLKSATDLAAASQTDLATSTSAAINVLLAYKRPLSDISVVSDQLFNINRITGLSIGELSVSVDRLHERLGVAAPSLGETGALVASLGRDGLTGSRGLLIASAAIDTLTSGSTQVNDTLRKLGIGIFDAQGNFIGLRNVIAQLSPAYAKLTEAQQAQTSKALFGSQVLTQTVLAGLPAYDRLIARVEQTGTASDAAARHQEDLAGQLEVTKNRANALTIELGQNLEPAATKTLRTFNDFFKAGHGGDELLGNLKLIDDELGRLGAHADAVLGKIGLSLGALATAAGKLAVTGFFEAFFGPAAAAVPLLATHDFGQGTKQKAPDINVDTITGNVAPHLGAAGADLLGLNAAIRETIKIAPQLGVLPPEFTDIASALKLVNDQVDKSSDESGIRLKIDALKNEKSALEAAGQSTKDVDDEIARYTRAQEAAAAQTSLTKDTLAIFGNALLAAGVDGATAGQQVLDLKKHLESLTPEQKIRIAMILPDLEMTRLARFIDDIVNKHYNIDIALNLETAPAKAVPLKDFLPGLGSGAAVPGLDEFNTSQINQALRDIAFKSNQSAGAVGGLADTTAKAGSAASQADLSLQALAEAFRRFHDETGGTIEDFKVLLKLESDAISVDQRVAEAQTNLNAATLENQNASYQLKLTYISLSEEAIRSGKTMEQVTAEMFRKIAQQAADAANAALSAIQSDISKVSGETTVEDAQLQLKLDQLKKQRDALASVVAGESKPGTDASGNPVTIAQQHLAEQKLSQLESERAAAVRRGASEQDLKNLDIETEKVRATINAKTGKPDAAEKSAAQKRLDALDKEIQTIQDQITARRDELAIMKDKIALDDKALPTDKARLDALKLLDIALKDQSKKTADLNGILFLEAFAHQNVTQAADDAAAALRQMWLEIQQSKLASGKETSQQFFDSLSAEERLRLARLLEALHAQGKLAGGGLVTGPINAALGEGGFKELVLPLGSPQTKQILATMPQLISGQSGGSNIFNPTLNLTAGMTEVQVRSEFHRLVDEMFYGARSFAGRSGSVLSSSIN